ncbi:hypothetical protein TrLO_g7667 [Triparma laevis f. longispina]|uniref:Uncharacterized protein n=2 Tax=Triparma laevis f. longispina TaxID=1714387 RepID=A0A9W6ZJ28_9STRA|nr:hypothetical protein TrLO_g7667 [Triparma laevis f. longispina]
MTTNLAQAEMTNVRDSSSGSKSVTKDSNIIEAISTAVNGLRGSRRNLGGKKKKGQSASGKSSMPSETSMPSATFSVGSKSGGKSARMNSMKSSPSSHSDDGNDDGNDDGFPS